MTTNPELMDIDTAAALLGIRARTMDLWRLRGDGPTYIRVGGQIRYRRADIEAYLTARTVTPQRRRTAMVG